MSLPRRMTGLGLFALGLLISITLIVVALWPDLEAEYYGFTRLTSARFKGMRCPVLMAADEQPLITARVTNRTPDKTNIAVRAIFSHSGLPYEQRDIALFEPGQTRVFSSSLSRRSVVLLTRSMTLIEAFTMLGARLLLNR